MLIGQCHCHKRFLNYPIGQLDDFPLLPHSRQVPSLARILINADWSMSLPQMFSKLSYWSTQ